MVKKSVLMTIGPVILFGGISAVVAQNVEGLNLDTIRERAAEQTGDAQALFDYVTREGGTHDAEAQAVVDNGVEAIQRIKAGAGGNSDGPVDLDEMLAGAKSNLAGPKDAPLFVAFASFSMPEDSLKRMIQDVTRAGGVVVFRGFAKDGARSFIKQMAKVADRESANNLAIDPRLFRAFGVDRAPTYVAVSTNFELCDQLDCVSSVPPHDKLVGNVSTTYALRAFVDADGPGAGTASAALGRLERGDAG
ncbi:type-F conjugative transfer system pilin assembly protein TrbC [Altericroceibacterium spongiae]|uniref:Type-F conjugative transfer system pilin assembly protein TrbC n=1 Tax=Altericroceibacterium spongiae TaxID=2320269 RepID=A0A420EAL4_9SPHN|nr:type-F conjugative transfer system pilin assembly protein TrbC [Altericroceibacterium spongiae]RKF17710.1 type-F conjugative transfer system pilin assembly protein TrbC [Altericroceibacterium spongiae]